jgi:outer membrane protein OmpA-like peptidoglycan-associated protein
MIRDRLHILAAGALALLLQACATAPPSARNGAPAVAPSRAPALATERQWLQSWFNGTPVQIAQRGDSAISVDVPREHSFDAGRSSVRAPLAAVLDKVAESLRRNPQARLSLVAAPADPGGAPALALQRAAQVRAHLQSRGVAAPRLAEPSSTGVAAVQLQLRLEPGPD